jgi:hypothetical protein
MKRASKAFLYGVLLGCVGACAVAAVFFWHGFATTLSTAE